MLGYLKHRLHAGRIERALAGMPERLRRDIGAGSEELLQRQPIGMIHPLAPDLLRALPEPPAEAVAERRPAPPRRAGALRLQPS